MIQKHCSIKNSCSIKRIAAIALHMYTWMHEYIHLRMHEYIHVRMHEYIHACTCTFLYPTTCFVPSSSLPKEYVIRPAVDETSWLRWWWISYYFNINIFMNLLTQLNDILYPLVRISVTSHHQLKTTQLASQSAYKHTSIPRLQYTYIHSLSVWTCLSSSVPLLAPFPFLFSSLRI